MTRARAACFVVLSALLVATLSATPYLPTTDGPEWIYLAHVRNHLGDPLTRYPVEYSPALAFASRGFLTLYQPLERWLGWQRGLQVALSVMVLFAAWGFVALVQALDRRRWALACLGFPLALSWHLYMGFWSFVLGSALGLVTLAIALRAPRLSGSTRVVLSLLLLAQALAHVFSAVLTGSVLAVVLVSRMPRGERMRELGRTLLMGLPAAIVLAECVVVSAGKSALMMTRTGWDRLSWDKTFALLPQTLAPGPLSRSVVFAVALGVVVIVASARVFQRDTGGLDRGLAAAGLALLVLGVFAPVQVPGWSFFSQRFLPLGMALVLAVVPIERAREGLQRVVAVGLFTATAAWLLTSLPFHRRLASTVADAILGLAAPVHRTKRQLPVALLPAELSGVEVAREVPLSTPLLHMGALYAVSLGGVVPSVFTVNPAVHPVVRRAIPGEPEWIRTPERYWGALGSPRFQSDPTYHDGVQEQLASLGVFYEGVVLLGARDHDVALWSDRGYVSDWQSGSAFVGHFKGCHLDVVVADAPSDSSARFNVRVGDYQLISDAHPPPHIAADGVAHFDIARAPCGEDVAVKVRWVRATGAAPAFCQNADASGELHAAITRSSGVVRCTPP